MARLVDTSRMSFALDDLTADSDLMPDGFPAKTSMKEIFSRKKLKKDGTVGVASVMPSVAELQSWGLTRGRWIEYSAHDAGDCRRPRLSFREACVCR